MNCIVKLRKTNILQLNSKLSHAALIIRNHYTERTVRRVIPHIFYDKKIEVTVTSDTNSVNKWILQNLQSTKVSPIPVGFDVEWRSVFQKAAISNLVSIIQLSTLESCLVIQIKHLIQHDGSIPAELIKLIESDDIIKVGVGVREDLQRLQTDFNIDYGAYVDLGKVSSSKLKLTSTGLESLCHYYFGKNIKKWKSKNLQLSNWENIQLTDSQIIYAAYDSLSAIEMFDKMQGFGLIDYDTDNVELFHSVCDSSIVNHAETESQSSAVEVDSDLLPLSRKGILKLISNFTNESSYKKKLLLKHFYAVDMKWYDRVTSCQSIQVNHPSFWRRSFMAYLLRFDFSVKFLTWPKFKVLIEQHKCQSLDTSSDSNFIMKVMDFVQIKNSTNEVVVFITVNGECISFSSGSDKASVSEIESKRLLFEFIQYQSTVPIEQYIQRISNVNRADEAQLPQKDIAQYVVKLSNIFYNTIHKRSFIE